MADALDEKLLLYADDSAILVSGKDVTDIELLLQKELAVVSEWLIDNKLSLYLGKQNPFCLDPDLGLGLNLIFRVKVLPLKEKFCKVLGHSFRAIEDNGSG